MTLDVDLNIKTNKTNSDNHDTAQIKCEIQLKINCKKNWEDEMEVLLA